MLVIAGERRVVPSRFAALLFSLSAALSFRAIDHSTHHVVAGYLAFVSFAFFPLAAALFIEAALPAGLPLPLKVLLLLGVVIIPIAGLVPPVFASRVFWGAVGTWQLVVFGSLVVFLAWRMAIAHSAAARSTAGALLLGAALATITLGNDWAGALGAETPQIGAALTIVVFYVVGEALFAKERFLLRPTLARLGVAAGAAVAVTSLLSAVRVLRHDHDSLLITGLVIFFCCVAVLPLRTVLRHTRQRRNDTLELRLAALPTSSWPTFFAALSTWPELRAVRVFTTAQLTLDGFDALAPLLIDQGHVLDRVDFARLSDSGELAQRRAAEQGLHLLTTLGFDALVPIGADGAALCVGFAAIVPSDSHRRALTVVGALARLLYASTERATTMAMTTATTAPTTTTPAVA